MSAFLLSRSIAIVHFSFNFIETLFFTYDTEKMYERIICNFICHFTGNKTFQLNSESYGKNSLS